MNKIYETLKKLKVQEKKPAMHIYKDETTGKIKEVPLSKSSAGALKYNNAAKLIHDWIFGNG